MMSSLDTFRELPLVELFLKGNPFLKRIKDNAQYVRYLAFSSAPARGVT